MSLPQRINVMKVVSYDVPAIVQDIRECHLVNHGEEPKDEITIQDCLEWIEAWVEDDFGSTRGLIYQDENGAEL